MLKKHSYDLVLVLLIILENLFLFVFYQQHITNQAVNSACYFSVSFLFGIVLLIKFYKVPEISVYPKTKSRRKYLLILLYTACFLLLNSLTIRIIKTTDFAKVSDIIPAIQILTKRFLSGQVVYSSTAWEPLGYHGPANYLPMHWLPFSIAEFFHFDYRTITFAIWCLGASLIVFRSMRCKALWVELLVPVLLSGCYLLMVSVSPGIMGVTVEMMVAGYYILLIAGLNQKNVFLTGLFIGFCLLSRYYIIAWLPLWAFALFISGNKKELFRTTLVIFAVVCVLYVFPFLSKNWTALYSSVKGYESYPSSEWGHLNADGLPWHLYSETGFAYLFYQKHLHTNLIAGFELLRNTLNMSIAFSMLAMGAWHWFNRKKINYKIFLLASFNIYLSIFLAFITVPYLYLMITANFVSIAIFAEQARYRLGDAN